MNTFSDALISPGASVLSARISWQFDGAADSFVVYRKTNNEWECLTEDGVKENFYEDNLVPQDTPLDDIAWRVVAEDSDGEVLADTGPLRKNASISRREWAGIRRIALAEYYTIKRDGGVKVAACRFLRFGKLAKGLSGKSGAAVEMETSGEFEHGYSKPYWTWMAPGPSEKDVESDNAMGAGKEIIKVLPAKFPAWPPIGPRDLVMFGGRLYAVGDAVQTFAFKGIYPVSFAVDLILTRPADPRVKLFDGFFI